MAEAGEIRNRNNIKQIIKFSGLKYGAISPTDIDGFLDFGDKLFIFLEIKYGATPLPFGQNLALERLTDATATSERKTFCIIASHTSEITQDIEMFNALVRSIRYKREWKDIPIPMTVADVISKILKKHAPQYLF